MRNLSFRNKFHRTPLRNYSIQPPTYFADPRNAPTEYSATIKQTAEKDSPRIESLSPIEVNEGKQQGNPRFIKDFASLVAVCGLTYIAVDNYINRIESQRSLAEITAINQLKLHDQKVMFLNNQKKRDFQAILERRDAARRQIKMGIYIAILRKQLQELGIEPAKVEDALKEFDQHVKVVRTSPNLNAQVFQLDDSSSLKAYMTKLEEYDKKGPK